ncbi:MoaD/ThiS family protein [Nevskia ramosa]|uniref:MoaD/ThiS family protein n=1 Tax=Nevskia ramosa TaxID=64002 RepID=UPI0003FBD766|nr:MoaD/ThiS family protein [Nevskia ramosa]
MKIVIECYGASARWCGSDAVTLELPAGATGSDALDALADRYPDFAARRDNIAIASGDAIVSPAAPLFDGDVIALIPPVSAG